MKEARNTIIIIVAFVLYYIASTYFRAIMIQVQSFVPNGLAAYIITYVLIGIPLIAGTLPVVPGKNILKAWGLNGNIVKGFLVALVFTLPMFVGGLVSYKISKDIDVPNLLAGTILAGFFEETYFRGFLFGLLFRFTRAGFIIAAIMGAVIFATGHLYQSTDVATQVGIFLVTFLGAGFFAWLYVEWQYNLWVPIFLHTFMNLAWMAFSVSENAMGSMYANIFRAITIAMAITVTIVYKRKTGKKFEVNKSTLFISHKSFASSAHI